MPHRAAVLPLIQTECLKFLLWYLLLYPRTSINLSCLQRFNEFSLYISSSPTPQSLCHTMGFTRAAEDRPTPPEVYGFRIYLLTFLTCLGSWMFGYNNGVIPTVLVLPSFFRDFHLPPVGTQAYNDVTANIVSLLPLGALPGSMATFLSMKYLGRKIGLMIAAITYLFGAMLQVRLNYLIRHHGLIGL